MRNKESAIMEHSKKFKTVKGYYDKGLWTESMVRNAVGRWITEAEADEIITSHAPDMQGGD